jgi:hypothetical protein
LSNWATEIDTETLEGLEEPALAVAAGVDELDELLQAAAPKAHRASVAVAASPFLAT